MWPMKMGFLKSLQNSQEKAVPESLRLASLFAFKPGAYKKCKTKDSSGKTE